MKQPQLFPLSRFAPFGLAEHRRVGNGPSSQHQPPQHGILLLHPSAVGRSHQIAIIAKRQAGVFCRPPESLRPHRFSVKILTHPGMQNQLFQGVFFKNGQNGRKFLLRSHAQPAFHRNFHRQSGGKDFFQKVIQLLWMGQKPRSLALGGDSPRRTSQIQIDVLVAQFPQPAGRANEIPTAPGEQLRNQRQTLVFLRGDVPQLSFVQRAPFSRRKKGGIVPIDAAKNLMVRPPVQRAGDPLQRGQIIAHGRFLLCSSFFILRTELWPMAASSSQKTGCQWPAW